MHKSITTQMSYSDPMITSGKRRETVASLGCYLILIISPWNLVGIPLNIMGLPWDTHGV